jgi:hypothetical protein
MEPIFPASSISSGRDMAIIIPAVNLGSVAGFFFIGLSQKIQKQSPERC